MSKKNCSFFIQFSPIFSKMVQKTWPISFVLNLVDPATLYLSLQTPYEHNRFWRKKLEKLKKESTFWIFLSVKSHFLKNGQSKWVLFFFVAISASRRFIWATKQHYPIIFPFHISNGGPFWFRGVWALPQEDVLVKNSFRSVFIGPYGIPHTYKCLP